MKYLAILMACAALQGAGISASAQTVTVVQPTPEAALVSQVLKLEKRRCDAQMRRDIGALDLMLSEDLIYTRQDGVRTDKKGYLAYVAAAKSLYSACNFVDPLVHVIGNAAVVHGTFSYGVSRDQSSVPGESLYTAVYARLNGEWQLTNWEETLKRK